MNNGLKLFTDKGSRSKELRDLCSGHHPQGPDAVTTLSKGPCCPRPDRSENGSSTCLGLTLDTPTLRGLTRSEASSLLFPLIPKPPQHRFPRLPCPLPGLGRARDQSARQWPPAATSGKWGGGEEDGGAEARPRGLRRRTGKVPRSRPGQGLRLDAVFPEPEGAPRACSLGPERGVRETAAEAVQPTSVRRA